ncbi:hypothetical protein [Actinoplanes sp. NPDC026619]|uniref:hypothetical protein n=1 Tax=Actinoplanes sp. NPDC026619 TaxID=3155798 RepID=UPI0033E07E3E
MTDRQVLPRTREIAGATLTVSTSGGYSVLYEGVYIGYIHASFGDRWNAYVRRVRALDDYLGKLGQEEAVRRIIGAYRGNAGEKAVA